MGPKQNSILQTAHHLQKMAQTAYEQTEQGHYTPKQASTTQFEMLPFYDAFNLFYSARPPHPGRNLQALLARDGFNKFYPLNSGNDADVLLAKHDNGHNYALRITAHPIADYRPLSPMTVQPFYTIITNNGFYLEVMPLLHVLTQAHSQTIQGQIRTRLNAGHGKVISKIMSKAAPYAGTHATYFLLKDLGILPDGTPIQTDPGQIAPFKSPFTQTPAEIKDNLRGLSAHIAQENLPTQFNWFAADGSFKQDRFFINPRKRTPYYRGFAPKR